MPSLLGKAELAVQAGKKRKRDAKLQQNEPTIKRRATSPSTPEDKDENKDPQAQILLLENQILESRRNLNNVAHLVEKFRTSHSDTTIRNTAAVSLCRVFCRLIAAGSLTTAPQTEENEVIVTKWLQERYSEYTEELFQMLRNGDPSDSSTSLTLFMRLIKEEATHLPMSQSKLWDSDGLLSRLFIALLGLDDDESDTLAEFVQKYMMEYDDIRYYAFDCIAKLDADILPTRVLENILHVLAEISEVPQKKDDLDSFYISEQKRIKGTLRSVVAHKRKAQEAWLTLLRGSISKELRKEILRLMSYRAAPWFLNPELLMDFLTDSFDIGGATSLLALSGLFHLMQEKNLDYPQFYPKLYSLLDSKILHSKHRSRFFRLLDTFLDSTHLPAALVASFIKRLSRLALNAPPSGIVLTVPFIYNLFKKHPACTFMMHREIRNKEEKQKLEADGIDDPFRMDETDPMETCAIDSSIWEIEMLQSHYHPNVATLAKIISQQFTKQAYSLEDFLDHSYGSMLEGEFFKEVKKDPVIEYQIPKRIFTKGEGDSADEDSLLVKLWDF
ncbi:MAG: hypothetical protein M1834_007776 [Cirrosporium novae-zelandiae]|nr:MAG: hypothetical protein M1834_007776 [Cirrosporium novae-zelandiae]